MYQTFSIIFQVQTFQVLLLDKDELVVTDTFLHNLLSQTEHSGLKCLLSLKIGQRWAQGR